jgi:hypothetical protein
MLMKPLVFLVSVLLYFQGSAQTLSRDSVLPATTDPAITEYNFMHYFYKTNQDTMQSLVVFIPGTFRYAGNYKFVMEQLALLGYHVIGLSYKYDPAINPVCRDTGDINCHYTARMETINGIQPGHPKVNVSPANSILNRLQKLLVYLVNNRPGQGWNQFYSNGEIQWDKIIVTGHSQGASLSGILGKEFPVKRVVMFSVMDYLNNGLIPSWVDNTSGSSKYYALFHPKDEQIPFSAAQIGWDKLGMTQYGPLVNIDCNVSPYKNTHTLYTRYIPVTTLPDKYHNGTVLDIYIENETEYKASLVQAIKYLFKK